MDRIWTVLGIDPTKDVSAIKRVYAERAKICHPEEDPEGFLNLRRAYQAALDYAEGTEEEPSFSLGDAAPRMAEEDAEPTEEGWNLQETEEEGPNPFEGGEAITKFLELYTGKQRKNPALWMNYITSDPFLDAAWDPRFTSLLLRKVRELLPDLTPNKECMTWLNVAYQFSGGQGQTFDGLQDILQIAALGPVPKQPRGNEFAILQSFLDYRHLNALAGAGRWDQQAIEAFRQVMNRYSPAYIRERCEQRVAPDCERHPAGLRVFIHFLQRADLPETVYREAWQRLDLKSALMGRAKVLYGPIRELALQRVPEIGEETPVNFFRLNRNLDAYLKHIKVNPETEPEESRTLFESPEMRRALPVPRFLEEQLLTYSPWRREGMGEGLVRRLLDYYRAHPDIPRAWEVVSGLEKDLRLCEAKRWSREDDLADPEGISDPAQLTLSYRPFFRWWLNTAFYTARDPDTGTTLLEYLKKYLPYQENWSRRFAERSDGTPQTISSAGGRVEIDCYPLHLEYRVDRKPVYRPYLTWEETAKENDDCFFLLLPITMAPCRLMSYAAQEIRNRLDGFPIPQEDLDFVARCLTGYVYCQSAKPDTEGTIQTEEQLPFTMSMEGGGKLYTAERLGWNPITIYRQTFFGRRMLERLETEPSESGLEAAKRRLTELTAPTYFDLSRLRELPWHVYYTTPSGVEWSLIRPELQQEPLYDAWTLLKQFGVKKVPPDLEEAATRVQQAIREAAPEESEPQESPVTGEAISALLYNFSQGEVDRIEMEWSQGRLVLRRDEDKYACLYFENSFGRGERWYALLADSEMYQTVDCNDIVYLPFGMGKLAEYSVFHSAHDLLRDIDLVLGQMGYDQLQEGGPGAGSGAARYTGRTPSKKSS